MKKNLSSSLLTVILIVVMNPDDIRPVLAADVTFDADTTITINGIDLVVQSGCTADVFTINSTNFVVTTGERQTCSIVSTQKYEMATDPQFALACTSTQSQFIVPTATTVTVTPSATAATCPSTATPQNSGAAIIPPPPPPPAINPLTNLPLENINTVYTFTPAANGKIEENFQLFDQISQVALNFQTNTQLSEVSGGGTGKKLTPFSGTFGGIATVEPKQVQNQISASAKVLRAVSTPEIEDKISLDKDASITFPVNETSREDELSIVIFNHETNQVQILGGSLNQEKTYISATVKTFSPEKSFALIKFAEKIELSPEEQNSDKPIKTFLQLGVIQDAFKRFNPLEKFEGEKYITRIEMIDFTLRVFSYDLSKNIPKKSTFKDIQSGHKDNQSIYTGIDQKIIKGYQDQTVRPYNRLTDAKALAIMLRAKKLIQGNCEDCPNPAAPFADVKKEAWHSKVINFAYENNLIEIERPSITLFRPDDFITRAELSELAININNFE